MSRSLPERLLHKLVFCCASLACSVAVLASTQLQLALPAQPLDRALLVLAKHCDCQLAGLSSELANYQAPALVGSFTLEQALAQLLADTRLSWKNTAQGVVIVPLPPETTSSATQSPPAEHTALEEILVTSLRRETRLLKTPLAVTALNQSQLNLLQVKDIRDISPLVPSLEMTSTGEQSALLVQLRGIGQTNITEISDGPVAFHVDGIYLPRSQGAAALLHDIEQLEVLRGPQGTLYGRNATAGGINLHTRGADVGQNYGSLRATVGNYQKKALRAHANWAPTDTFALRLATALDQHQSYTQLLTDYRGLGPQYPSENQSLSLYQQGTVSAQGPEAENQYSVRLSGRWLAGERWTVDANLERYGDRGTSVAELDPALVARGLRAVVWDTPSALRMTNDTLRLKITGDLEHSTLHYYHGRARMLREQNFDQDMGRSGHFEQRRTHNSDFGFSSHELQWQSAYEATTPWVLGLFQASENNSIVYAIDHAYDDGNGDPTQTTSYISDDPGAAVALFVQPDRRVNSWAVYGQGTINLHTGGHLTAGLRYTEDTKTDIAGRSLNCRVTAGFPYTEPGSIGPGAPSADQIYADPGAADAIAKGQPYDGGTNTGIAKQPCWVRQVNDYQASWRNTSGLLRYDADLSPDGLVYASVSTGFKSGHIQDRGNEAQPEEVINWELGYKHQLGNQWYLSSALYRARYTNLQFSDRDQFDTNNDGLVDIVTSTVVRNAAKATVDGLEMELFWSDNRGQKLQLAASLMNARFDEFETPDTLFGNRFNPWAKSADAEARSLVDLSGNQPVRAPKWKLTLYWEKNLNWQGINLGPRLMLTASDRYYLDIFNRDQLPAGIYPGAPDGAEGLAVQNRYARLDLGFNMQPSDAQWELDFYIKNATDSQVKTSSGTFITPKGFDAIFLPPRTFGVALGWHF